MGRRLSGRRPIERAFEEYAAEYLADMPEEERDAFKTVFYAGAAIVHLGYADSALNIGQQRRSMRLVAADINEFVMQQIGRKR